MIGDDRRRDLYAFAAKAVGTAGSDSTETFRASHLVAWGHDMHRRRLHVPVLGRLRHRVQARRVMTAEDAARYAARSIPRRPAEDPAAALALVDELIAMGSPSLPGRVPEAWSKKGRAGQTLQRDRRVTPTRPGCDVGHA